MTQGEIVHQVLSIPKGTYTVSIDAMGVTRNNQDPQGVAFVVNDKSKRLTEGTTNFDAGDGRRARRTVFTLDNVTVGDDGLLNINLYLTAVSIYIGFFLET